MPLEDSELDEILLDYVRAYEKGLVDLDEGKIPLPEAASRGDAKTKLNLWRDKHGKARYKEGFNDGQDSLLQSGQSVPNLYREEEVVKHALRERIDEVASAIEMKGKLLVHDVLVPAEQFETADKNVVDVEVLEKRKGALEGQLNALEGKHDPRNNT